MHDRLVQMLSVGRYPEYIVDLLGSRLLFAWWRTLYDFRIGAFARIRGLPIVSLAGESSIRIGRQAFLISRSRNTALGVNHPIVLRTMLPSASIRIGDHFRASGVSLCAAREITVGDRVTVGANATVVDTDFHSLDATVRFHHESDEEFAKSAPVKIGDDVFIGMNALVLKGVNVGNQAVIAAGAVVTRNVPQSAMVGGNPARVITVQRGD